MSTIDPLTRRMTCLMALVMALVMVILCSRLSAEVLMLENGGRVEGELLNPDQSPRVEFVLKLKSGGKITLAADQVSRVVTSSPNEKRYLEQLKKMPDSAAGHFKMSEFCRKLKLGKQVEYHLEQVITLDPEHEKARLALGHVRLGNEWGETSELMKRRGYVKYKGHWRLPEDVVLIKQREENDVATKKWTRQLKKWRSWIGKRRQDEAVQNIETVDDPLATKGIVALLDNEANVDLQALLIRVLGRLETTAGLRKLIDLSLESDREETRQLCIDELEKHGREIAMLSYLEQLKSADHDRVVRAGWALQRVADRSAIEPLIDALVTTHKFKVSQGGPGQLNASQGTTSNGSQGVSGFGVGSGSKIVKQQFRNGSVLDALKRVVAMDYPEVNFRYDQTAWNRWLLYQSTPTVLDLRRDGGS